MQLYPETFMRIKSLAISVIFATFASINTCQALQYFEDMIPAPNQEQIDAIFLQQWKDGRNAVEKKLKPTSEAKIIKDLKSMCDREWYSDRIIFGCNVWKDPVYAIGSSGHSDTGKILVSYQFHVLKDSKVSKGSLYTSYLGRRALNINDISAELADRTMAIPFPSGYLNSVLNNNGLWYYEYVIHMTDESEDVLTAHLVGNGTKSKTKGVYIVNGGMGAEVYDFPQKDRTKLAQLIFLRKAIEEKNMGEKILKAFE